MVLAWLYCRRRGRSRRRRRKKKGETLEAHFSGVSEGIFVFSTPLESCGQGELVGAVLKARFARLENRSFRSLRSFTFLLSISLSKIYPVLFSSAEPKEPKVKIITYFFFNFEWSDEVRAKREPSKRNEYIK